MKFLLSLFTLVVTLTAYSVNAQEHDSIKIVSSEEYYPYIKLSEKDTLVLPITLELELAMSSLRDLNLKSDYFYSETSHAVYTKYDSIYVSQFNDTIDLNPIFFYRLLYPESDQHFMSNPGFTKINDSTYQEITNIIENVYPHKWDLRDYPFDTQNLRIVYRTIEDTSYVRLKESSIYKSKMYGDFPDLMDGFKIKGIKATNNFYKSPTIIEVAENEERESIFEELIFNIEIDREGSFLYFKLFFGAFLSFIISFLVFFIDKKMFETRITLSLGGIFGAVGNKYFVESSMPEIQVLTKADLINNLVILLIILNIFIIIAQHSKVFRIGFLSKNLYASYFMAFLFIITNLLIVFL